LYTYRLLCSLICKRLALVVTYLRPLYFCLVCYCLVHYCRVYSLLSRCATECCPRHSLRPTRYVTTLDCCSCKRAAHGFDSCGCLVANHDKYDQNTSKKQKNKKDKKRQKRQKKTKRQHITNLKNRMPCLWRIFQRSIII
jgi:hypothetical protein